MNIKRYIVNDMAEAVKAIKEEMGPDAIIVSTRKIRQKGWFKYFKQRKLEVTAAVDNKFPELSEQRQIEPKDEPVKKEIAEVKALLQQMVDKVEAGSKDLDELQSFWLEQLVNVEVYEDIAKGLLLSVSEKCPLDHPKREEFFKVALQTEIIDRLEPLYLAKGFDQRVVAFVGPTGVGKTTTLAKLAAQHTLFHKKKVALITIDTYRIGAVEQLKTYGEIIGLPVDVVMTPQELKKTIDKHNDKELIFIDTAGRSSKNTMQILELKGFLDTVQPLETCLVVSVTTKPRDIDKIVNDFKDVNFNKIIFTKVDETDTLGSIVNTIFKTNIPVAYITDGQNVPDDIQQLYPKKIAKLILKGVEQQ